MRPWLYKATITAAIMLTASTAVFAQYETNNRTKMGLRLSSFRPLSSALTDISGMWYGPTIDYNIKYDKNDRPTLVASLTMLGQEKESTKAKLTPLTLSYIKHFAKDQTSNGWYAGGGLGLYTLGYEVSTPWGNQKSSGSKLGASIIGGYEIGEAYFVELKYDKIGSVVSPVDGSIDFDGITLSLGTRIAY